MAKPKKTLGLDNQGIQKTLYLGNHLGYGIAAISIQCIAMATGMLTYFYTDKVGIAAATVGTILLVSKITDAVSDLGMGYIMDRTKTRWGKARPWLLWMAIPAFIIIPAIFMLPAGAGSGVKTVYALVSNILINTVVYTAIAIPFGSLVSFMTKSTEERTTLSLSRGVIAYIAAMGIYSAFIPATNALGGDQKAWIIVGIIVGLVAMGSLLCAFFSVKELDFSGAEREEEEKISFSTSVKLLFQNKYWVMVLLVNFSVAIYGGLASGSSIYYTKWILKNENLVALMGTITMLPTLVGFVITKPLAKRIGVTKLIRIGFLIAVAASLVRAFFPYNFVIVLTFGTIASLGSGPYQILDRVLVTNTVEYGLWKSGKRMVGMVNSASSFGMKIGGGIGAAMVGWILARAGYDGAAATQSSTAINGILLICFWLPVVIHVLCYLSLRLYDLDDKYPQIVKELEERAKRGSR
ncbi:MAG: glycoside-pentoside-hexuronide (GPH):cation symporter [Treponema sp.]|jgi:GPH family glycoside/pentoside/hexuronide:cation symporter|nr:glycoside-pentoside-hexuronide (GPH):cation symporter [Treponema sp.]